MSEIFNHVKKGGMRALALGFWMIGVGSWVLSSCQWQDAGKCRIVGTVAGEQYEGKRIFLVPLNGPATAETVDSVEIKDGRFEFVPDSEQMYKILMDYHFRMGLQTLLVVSEPGEVEVTIDSISSAKGTPQNDSLQRWKELTEEHNRRLVSISRQMQMLKVKGDTVLMNRKKEEAQQQYMVYKNRTRQMAASLKGTVLGSFLSGMFPLTYTRKMPDGTVVVMNADSHESVQQ